MCLEPLNKGFNKICYLATFSELTNFIVKDRVFVKKSKILPKSIVEIGKSNQIITPFRDNMSIKLQREVAIWKYLL